MESFIEGTSVPTDLRAHLDTALMREVMKMRGTPRLRVIDVCIDITSSRKLTLLGAISQNGALSEIIIFDTVNGRVYPNHTIMIGHFAFWLAQQKHAEVHGVPLSVMITSSTDANQVMIRRLDDEDLKRGKTARHGSKYHVTSWTTYSRNVKGEVEMKDWYESFLTQHDLARAPQYISVSVQIPSDIYRRIAEYAKARRDGLGTAPALDTLLIDGLKLLFTSSAREQEVKELQQDTASVAQIERLLDLEADKKAAQEAGDDDGVATAAQLIEAFKFSALCLPYPDWCKACPGIAEAIGAMSHNDRVCMYQSKLLEAMESMWPRDRIVSLSTEWWIDMLTLLECPVLRKTGTDGYNYTRVQAMRRRLGLTNDTGTDDNEVSF